MTKNTPSLKAHPPTLNRGMGFYSCWTVTQKGGFIFDLKFEGFGLDSVSKMKKYWTSSISGHLFRLNPHHIHRIFGQKWTHPFAWRITNPELHTNLNPNSTPQTWEDNPRAAGKMRNSKNTWVFFDGRVHTLFWENKGCRGEGEDVERRSGFGVERLGAGFRVWDSGFDVQGFGSWVWGIKPQIEKNLKPQILKLKLQGNALHVSIPRHKIRPGLFRA